MARRHLGGRRPLPPHPDRQQPRHPPPLPTRPGSHLASLQSPRPRTRPHQPRPTPRHRGIADGEIVRVFNDRGACLAGAVISDAVRPGVVQLSTGAWYDPLDPADPNSLCVHGNPNVLTRDAGTSRLAQGCAGQHSHVQLEPWTGPLPPIRAYDPPLTIVR